MQQFQFGDWVSFSAHQSSFRRWRRDQAIDVEKRAARALSLVRQANCVQQGWLSKVPRLHQAIWPLSVNSPILRRDLQGPGAIHNEPAVPFALDEVEFLVCFRRARREQQQGLLA